MAWKKDEGALGRWLSFSNESLSKIDDIELAALKIHLVLEDALKYLLGSRLGTDEEDFFDLQIDFRTLADIALAGIGNGHLLGALRALNTARNHLSHRMESQLFSEKLEVFVMEIAYMRGQKTKWPKEPQEQLGFLKKSFDDAAYAIFDIAINRPRRENA
jgi:hypothetical protein